MGCGVEVEWGVGHCVPDTRWVEGVGVGGCVWVWVGVGGCGVTFVAI